jgi:hypothetical protein
VVKKSKIGASYQELGITLQPKLKHIRQNEKYFGG